MVRGKLQRGRPLKGVVPRIRASFTLPPGTLDRLKKQAEERQISASEIVEQSLEEKMLDAQDVTTILSGYSALKANLNEVLKCYPIKRLSLFGSTRHQTANSDSDIDLLVEFIAPQTLSMFEMAKLESQLSDILGGKKVDLRTENELSRYFRDRVKKEAIEIYVR